MTIPLNDTSREQKKFVEQGVGRVGIRVEPAQYLVEYDEVSTTLSYLGHAKPGSTTSQAVWRIKKIATTGNDVSITFADGDEDFDNAWSDRESKSYS